MNAAIMNCTFPTQMVKLPSPPLKAVDASSPLTLWRTKRPDQLSRKDAASIRFALSGSALDAEHRWLRAISGDFEGDDAVAMDICIRQLKKHAIDAPEIDLAVSATLANALLGQTASAIFLSWVLRQRAKIDLPCALFSDLWLVADF